MAALSGARVPSDAATWPARCVTKVCLPAPFRVSVPLKDSVTAIGSGSVGPTGSLLSQAAADRPMARMQARDTVGRIIGMIILLDDNDGTAALAGLVAT